MHIELDGLVLRAYELTSGAVSGIPDRAGPAGMERLDALAVANESFAYVLNAANAAAFANLGMPMWVQVDCATLPTAYHGFAVERDAVPAKTWERIEASAQEHLPEGPARLVREHDGLVPLSGFCAARTFGPDAIVGFSLFSLLSGLALRTKCLGLLVHGSPRQVGISQYDNPVLRVHSSIGALRVVDPQLVTHSKPATFVYEIAVPPRERLLEAVEHGTPPAGRHAAPNETLPADAETGALVRARMKDGDVHIVAPGLVFETGGPRLCVGAR